MKYGQKKKAEEREKENYIKEKGKERKKEDSLYKYNLEKAKRTLFTEKFKNIFL
jgi:hypothetical protein